MNTSIEHPSSEVSEKAELGFWIYLMTDCVLFASLFATFAVLRNNTFGGATARDLFHPPFVLVETLLLLTSSFTCGLIMLSAKKKSINQVIMWLFVTFLLGSAFLAMELTEFQQLVNDGNSWKASAFLSSFFTLVGTHGLHIAIGLLWMFVLVLQIHKRGLIESVQRKLKLFSLFWHFLDIIWICIFTIVYLRGVY